MRLEGIEPPLGPHLGHTIYKIVDASSYITSAKINEHRRFFVLHVSAKAVPVSSSAMETQSRATEVSIPKAFIPPTIFKIVFVAARINCPKFFWRKA
jgi:hypothetical protein